MGQEYSDPKRARDPHSLPDIEVFQLTAEELAESGAYHDEIEELLRRREFRLSLNNNRCRQRLFDTLIEEQGITGGWYWQACFPGCLPDGEPMGPFATYAEALADAQQNNTEE